MNRNRVKDEFNNQSLFKNFNKFKKRKFYNDLNLNFKSLREDNDVTTRVLNNNIKRSSNTHNNRNNDIYVCYKKKVIENLIVLIVISLKLISLR